MCSSSPTQPREVVAIFVAIRGLALGAMDIYPSQVLQQWFVRKRGVVRGSGAARRHSPSV